MSEVPLQRVRVPLLLLLPPLLRLLLKEWDARFFEERFFWARDSSAGPDRTVLVPLLPTSLPPLLRLLLIGSGARFFEARFFWAPLGTVEWACPSPLLLLPHLLGAFVPGGVDFRRPWVLYTPALEEAPLVARALNARVKSQHMRVTCWFEVNNT